MNYKDYDGTRKVMDEYAHGPRLEMAVEISHQRARLQRAEELLRESRNRIAGAINTGQIDQCHDFIHRIDAFLGGHYDD